MFPEITREDVFRLETRRLWLRWPLAADALAADACATGAEPLSSFRTAKQIEQLRRDNAVGRTLNLLLTGHGADRQPFGSISLAPLRERLEDCGLLLQVWLAEDRRGSGLMTEAVQAVADAAFMLTETPLLAASSRVLDPAFRRVLEKCGFAYCGTGLDSSGPGGGLFASDRFRLDRKAWTSLKMWRIPGMVRDRGGAQLGCPA